MELGYAATPLGTRVFFSKSGSKQREYLRTHAKPEEYQWLVYWNWNFPKGNNPTEWDSVSKSNTERYLGILLRLRLVSATLTDNQPN